MVLAVGLLERGPQGLGFVPVPFLEVADLAGQREDERVAGVVAAGRGRLWAGLGTQTLDPGAKIGVCVEEGVGDAGFALDGGKVTGSPRLTSRGSPGRRPRLSSGIWLWPPR
jgi:hypothetical protein